LGDVAAPPTSFTAPGRSLGRPAVLAAKLTLNNFGLAWGLLLLAIMAAMGAAFGLRRLTDDVFAVAPAAATCPLEEGPQR
jgi:hypothetical protein